MNTHPQLSQAARTTLDIFCRVYRKQPVSEDDYKKITAESVLDLHEGGFIDRPVELVGLQFSDSATAKLTLRRTQEILLTPTGRNYCDTEKV